MKSMIFNLYVWKGMVIKMLKRFINQYAKQTLHVKVKISILLFSLFPLILFAFISFFFVYRNEVVDMQRETYEDALSRFSDMNYKMSTIELLAKTVWSDTTFITEVGQAVLDEGMGGYNRYLFQRQTLSSLKVITGISQVECARLHLEYVGMREYAPYVYDMDRAKDSLWYEERNSLGYSGEWYLNSLDTHSSGVYSNYFANKDMASYVIPIKINNDITGIFEIVLPMKDVVSGLYEYDAAQDNFLVDAEDRILGIEENGEFAGITVDDLEEIIGVESLAEYNASEVSVYRGNWKQGPVVLSIAGSDDNDILLMQITSVRRQYLNMIWDMIVILLLEIIITAILYRAINGIVKRLLHDFEVFSGCMIEVENGNLDVEIPKLEQVEINAVALEYNRMLGRVKQLMEITVHREVMVKEAQLKSLEQQINSHFLFNVLDSIKMMAEVKGIYNVSDALLALARMFRYNLQIESHSVTLQEEISYLESYLSLCNIRFDYHVTLSENIEELLRRLKVPKVILQPIAENSITHGLDELEEDTTIYLKAYVKDACAYIEMTDMGKGIEEESLNRIRYAIEHGGGGESTNGIGLHNIHERLQLMFGEPYGVTIYSKENCYTKVILTIPMEVQDEKNTLSGR